MLSGYWAMDQGLVNNEGLIPAVGVIPTRACEELKSVSHQFVESRPIKKLARAGLDLVVVLTEAVNAADGSLSSDPGMGPHR
jgi:hypothetical protein